MLNAFINNSRDFWYAILKYVRKLRITSALLNVTPTTMQFSCVSLIIISCKWKESYSYVCNDIGSCNDRESFTGTMDAIINAIKHLKRERVMVSTVYLLIILSTILRYYLISYLAYLHVCYLIVLYPLHFQSLLL